MPFFTIARSLSQHLSPSLGRLSKAAEQERLAPFVPPDETGRYLTRQSGTIQEQKRIFDRLAKEIKVYPLDKRAYRAAFADACRRFLKDYIDLKEVGDPVRIVHLNTLAPRPSHRRPPKVSKRRWEADLRRIRKMRAMIDAVGIQA
jgi:hypothetical protein